MPVAAVATIPCVYTLPAEQRRPWLSARLFDVQAHSVERFTDTMDYRKNTTTIDSVNVLADDVVIYASRPSGFYGRASAREFFVTPMSAGELDLGPFDRNIADLSESEVWDVARVLTAHADALAVILALANLGRQRIDDLSDYVGSGTSLPAPLLALFAQKLVLLDGGSLELTRLGLSVAAKLRQCLE
jgi:hypothetical protein